MCTAERGSDRPPQWDSSFQGEVAPQATEPPLWSGPEASPHWPLPSPPDQQERWGGHPRSPGGWSPRPCGWRSGPCPSLRLSMGSGLPLQLCPSVPQICRACARPRRHWGKAAWPAPSSACTCSRESCTLRRSGGGLGAGEGVRKGAGPKLGGPHSKLTPAGLAEAGPAVCPALPPTPRTRRTGPSGRPGHSG